MSIKVSELSQAKKVLSNEYTSVREYIEKTPRPIRPEVVDLFPALEKTILDRRRVCRTLQSGKSYRFRILVAVGCKVQGIIGLGVAKGKTMPQAIDKAQREAKKNLICLKKISEGEQLTRFGPTRQAFAKMGATGVTITPLPDGESVTSSKFGKDYCRVAGITNIRISTCNKGRYKRGKVASRLNYYTALHAALKLS